MATKNEETKPAVSTEILTWEKVKRTLPGGGTIEFAIEMDFAGCSKEDIMSAALHYLGEQWTHRNMSNNAYKNPVTSMAAQDLAKQAKPVVKLVAIEEINRTRAAATATTAKGLMQKARALEATEPIEAERIRAMARELAKKELAELQALLG